MITIITVSYNAASSIEATIRSVSEQKHSEIEYIVVDGGSTDGTAELIHSYSDVIDRWSSEPDEGIADAMNKGLYSASGDYILYLNADDYLRNSEAIEYVIPYLTEDIVSGPIVKLDETNGERVVWPRGLGWWMNFKTGLYHQATLCRRELLRGLGGFDPQFEIAMDYDLFLRAYRRSVSFRDLQRPFSVMGYGGISTAKDPVTLRRRLFEEREIHRKNCPNKKMAALYKLYWATYWPYKRVWGYLKYIFA